MKKKEKKMKGMKRWGAGKTAASVIAGVAGITGATVLGVYFAGGFNERIIYPEEIEFDIDDAVISGDAGFSYNTEFRQIETCEDFEIVLNATNKGVTKNNVTLSLKGGEIREGGYISNNIIQVPQKIKLGQPIKVKLVKSKLKDKNGNYILDENGNTIDWINGGLATLCAQSEIDSLGVVEIKIAVDVPVYKTETTVVNASGKETDKITVGETFSVHTNYIPARSQYMFSDMIEDGNGNWVKNENIGTATAREKHSFYRVINNSNVRPLYEGEDKFAISFIAENISENIEIGCYPFINAKDELESIKNITTEDHAEFYIAMINAASASSGEDYATSRSRATFSVDEQSITSFTVNKSSISMSDAKKMRLYVQQYSADTDSEYLAVRINPNDEELISPLKNVVLRTNDDKITIEGEEIEIDGNTYVKPYAATNPRYCYWNLKANNSGNANTSIEVYLLVNSKDGYSLFKENDEAKGYAVSVSIIEHEEQDVSWKTASDVEVVLKYNEQGKIKPESISEADLFALTNVPEGNIYQDKIFFAYIGGEVEEEIALLDSMLGKNGYDVQRSGLYNVNGMSLRLYPIVLNSGALTVYSSGKFSLYYGTWTGEEIANYTEVAPGTVNSQNYADYFVKIGLLDHATSFDPVATYYTQIDDDFSIVAPGIVDENNYADYYVVVKEDYAQAIAFEPQRTYYTGSKIYKMAKMSQDKLNLVANESLSANSIVSKTLNLDDFDPIEDDSNRVYNIPKTTLNTFEVSYEVSEGARNIFESELGKGNIALSVLDSNGGDITSIFAITSEFADGKYTCTLKPNSLSFDSEVNIWKFVLGYNGEQPITWDLNVDNYKIEQKNIEICVYSPETDTIVVTTTSGYEGYIDGSSIIVAKQELNASGEFEVDLGGEFGNDIEQMIDTLISSVTITDQKGDVSTLADKWQFVVRKGANAINLLDNNQSFAFKLASGEEVELGLESLDGEDSGILIKLNVTSVGIYRIKYASAPSTTSDEKTEQDDISNVTVEKYGAKDKTLTLSDLVEFYISEDEQYINTAYKFDSAYILALTEEDFRALFGDDGMFTISVKDSTDGIAYNYDIGTGGIAAAKQDLLGKFIVSLTMNKDFASNAYLKLNITDTGSSNAFSTKFNLNILPNLVASDATCSVYAMVESNKLTEIQVTNRNADGTTTALSSRYNTGYITQDGGKYVVVATDPGDAVATINAGKITFNDFLDRASDTFDVHFTPDGENKFALDVVVKFTVARNVKIVSTSKEFFVANVNEETRGINTFVTITREEGDAPLDVEFGYDFEKYLKVEGGLVKLNGTDEVFFNYNEQELSTTLTITYETYDLGEIDIKIKPYNSSDSFYNVFADNFVSYQQASTYDADTQYYKVENSTYVEAIIADEDEFNEGTYFVQIKSSLQKIAGVDYVMVTNKQWFTDLDVEISKKNFITQESMTNTLYNTDGFSVSFKNQALLLAGINDARVLLAFEYQDSLGNTLFKMHMPIIISSIGLNFVKYDDKLEVEADKTLETAITNPAKLVANNQFITINAGEIYKLADYIDIKSGPNVTNTFEYYPIDSSVGYSTSDIIKSLAYDATNGWQLSLNSATKEMYLPIKWTVLYKSVSQSFYILFKVEADCTCIANYPFDSKKDPLKEEHIQAGVGLIKEIDLTATFDEMTLKKDQTRFLVNNATSTLPFANEVYSVSINDGPEIFDRTQWLQYIETSISNEYETLTITPLVSGKINLVVKHTYPGNNAGGLAIVDGETFYKFVINENNIDYSLRYTDGQGVTTDPNKTWNINNYSNPQTFEEIDHDLLDKEHIENYYIKTGENNYTKASEPYDEDVTYYAHANSLTINLIQNAEAGQSSSGTIVYDVLNVKLVSGNDAILGCKYDSAVGKFTIFLKDYIGKDETVKFAAYTKYGSLGLMTVNLKSNVSVELAPTYGNAQLGGGDTIDAANLFTFTKDGDSATPIITNIELSEADGQYVNITDSSIQVADLLQDKTISATFTVTFADTNTFTFTQEFTLKTNITPVAALNTCNIIAKEDTTIDLASLYTNSNPSLVGTHTITASSTSAAFDGREGNTIKTKYVSELSEATITITSTLDFNGWKQTFNTTLVLRVHPAAKLETYYPSYITNDSSVATKFEYVEHESTFTNIWGDLLAHTASFRGNDRLEMRDATSVDGSGEVSYGTDISALPTKDFLVTIDDMSNAKVKQGDATLNIHSQLDMTKSLTLSINDLSSTVQSFVVFNIEYKGVTTKYKMVILEHMLTLDVNMATNNITPTGENIYVDSTSTTGLFAQGRMAKASMKNVDAYANDYYFVFSKNNEYYISYPISILTTDSGKDLTFDLGIGMTGKTFAGAYLVSAFNANDWVADENRRLVQKNTTTPVPDLSGTTNFAGDLFVDGITLANRIQVKYGEYELDYNEYAINFNTDTATGTIDTLDNITIYSTPLSIDNGLGTIKYTNLTLDEFTIYYIEQINYNVLSDQSVVTSENYNNYYVKQINYNELSDQTIVDSENYTNYYVASDVYSETSVSSQEELDAGEYYTRSGEEGNYTYTLADTYDSGATYYSKDIEYVKLESYDSEATYYEQVITYVKATSYDDNETYYEQVITYVKATSYDASKTYYTFDGDVYTEVTVTAETFSDYYALTGNVYTKATEYHSDWNYYKFILKPYFTGSVYSYTPRINIEVAGQISSAGNYETLTTNEEYASVVDLFDIRRASNGKLLTKADFSSADLTVSVVGSASGTDWANILETYYGGNSFDTTTPTSGQYYLYFSAMKIDETSQSSNKYDYHLLPLGAPNDGIFQLLKIEYKVGEFSKTFYTVVKVMPDYIVSYGGSTGNVKEEIKDGKTIIANENAYELSTIRENGTYEEFKLTASGSAPSGYLSIKHQNGVTANIEQASNFTITLQEDQDIGDATYNLTLNVTNKLMNATDDDNWGLSGNVYTSNGNTSFSAVPKVVFADQHYVIEGVDAYGYQFRLYFTLKSEKQTPVTVENTYYITEGANFDIGSKYQFLQVTNNSNTLTISSTDSTPAPQTGVTSIVVQNITGWLFDKDYADNTTPSTNYFFENNPDGGYELKEGYTMSNADKLYLSKENNILANVTIKGITLKSTSGDTLHYEGSIGTYGVNLATDSGAVFNDIDPREISQQFTMPQIKNTEIFGRNDYADIIMYVKLGYKDGELGAEEYELPVNVRLTREYNINDNKQNKVHYDNESFDVSDIFDITNGDIDYADQISYTNDTIEITVKAASIATINLTLTNGENDTITKSMTISNVGYAYNKTYYYSLSQIFGEMVEQGEQVTINSTTNCLQVKYGTWKYTDLENISTNVSVYDYSSAIYANSTFTNTSAETKDVKYYIYTLATEFDQNETYYTYANNTMTQASNVTSENFGEGTYYTRGDLSELFTLEANSNNSKVLTEISTFTSGKIIEFVLPADVSISTALNGLVISQITHDQVNIEHYDLIEDNGYAIVNKYYIINLGPNSEYKYLVTKQYFITGYYYQMDPSSQAVVHVLNNNGTTAFSEWKSALTLYDGEYDENTNVKTKSYDTSKNYANLIFAIDTSDGGSGDAIINNDNSITLGHEFAQNEYITVVVRMKLSGYDGDFDTDSTGDEIVIGRVRLGVE